MLFGFYRTALIDCLFPTHKGIASQRPHRFQENPFLTKTKTRGRGKRQKTPIQHIRIKPDSCMGGYRLHFRQKIYSAFPPAGAEFFFFFAAGSVAAFQAAEPVREDFLTGFFFSFSARRRSSSFSRVSTFACNREISFDFISSSSP